MATTAAVHPIGFPTATNREIACEGLVINLRCPSHRVIFIEGANYGRTDNLTCARNPRRMRNTNCRHPDSLKIMSDRCNSHSSCKVGALDATFGGDPCPKTYKFLEVHFKCLTHIFECPGTLESVGRPETLTQMGTKIGSWYRDPVPGVDKGKIYVMPWRPFNTISVDEYADIDDLKDLKPSRTIPLPDKVDGTGFVVYDGAAYYNKERSPSIIKFNLSTLNRDLQKELPGARYHNEAPYRFGGMSDIDLAVDENGLWAIYATEESEGRMVIAKLDPDSLAVEKTWETNYNKRAATNTFMVCGKLYVVSTRYVQPVDTGGKLVYVYDTSTGDGENLNLPFYNQYGYNTQVDYNPRDNSLHVWDNGYLLSYPLTFEADVPTVNPDKEGLVTTPAPILQPTTQNRPEPPQRPVSTRRPPARPATTTAAPVGPQRPDTVTSRPSPQPTAPVSTTTEETPAFLQQFCPPMFARNISWPRTPAGEVSKQPCPPGTDGGVATWRCGRNPVQWSTATPDLTDCTSRWVAGINRKIRDGESALDIAQDLVGKITESREIYGGDVKKAVKIMDQLVVLVTSQVQNMEPQDKQESLNTFTQTLVEAGSMLLDEDRVESWEDMSAGEQSISATTLVKTVDENGLLLAEHLPPRRKVTATDNNIAMEVLVVDTTAMEVLVVDTTGEVEDMSFPPEGNAISDVITLPGPSIKAHGRNGTAKVVFVTYSTLGRFLSSNSPTHGDINFVDSSERMLGTRVIAASINRLEQQQLLPEPVVFTLEHTQENVSGPLCSFWKYEPLGLKSDRNTIHKNLCFNLIIAELFFLIGIDKTQYQVACPVFAAILHFFFLASFAWMCLEGFQLYVMVIEECRWLWLGCRQPSTIEATEQTNRQIVMYHNVKNKDGSLSNGTIETSESNGQMPANMVPNFHANPYHADSYCEDFSISDTNFYHIGNGGDPTGKVVIPCLVDANIGRPPDVNGKKKSLGGAPIEEEDLHEREKTPLLQRHSVVSDSSREDSDESSTRAPLVPDMQDGNKKDQTTHHRSMPNLDSHPEKGERPPGDGASNLDGQHFQSTPNLSPAKQPQHQRQSVLMRGTSDGIVNTASRCYRYSTDSEISFGAMKDQDVHTDPEFGGDTAIPPHPDFSEC
uniref:SUEL-type lectin domain-containing protein n=1 Tax=Branchiostoma floridae TaxID=7739 RepID=C3ZJ73_BRAFL|eukprot:XP_002591393.1 hypothetical protein BRAFLDRAFT_86900 [Branchiostoma floridae]